MMYKGTSGRCLLLEKRHEVAFKFIECHLRSDNVTGGKSDVDVSSFTPVYGVQLEKVVRLRIVNSRNLKSGAHENRMTPACRSIVMR